MCHTWPVRCLDPTSPDDAISTGRRQLPRGPISIRRRKEWGFDIFHPHLARPSSRLAVLDFPERTWPFTKRSLREWQWRCLTGCLVSHPWSGRTLPRPHKDSRRFLKIFVGDVAMRRTNVYGADAMKKIARARVRCMASAKLQVTSILGNLQYQTFTMHPTIRRRQHI